MSLESSTDSARSFAVALTLAPLLASGVLVSPASSQCEGEKLVASDAGDGDELGVDVDIAGDVAIVGAHEDDEVIGDSGSAYVYRWSGSAWVEEQKLTSPNPGSNYHLGQAVTIEGVVAAAGVPDDDDVFNKAGSVEVYRFDGATWNHEQEVIAADGADGDRFGWAVDVSGPRLVVGAKFDDDGQSNAGSAYVFRHNGASWVQEQKLVPSDAAQNEQFGDAVAIDGELIVVGAWQDDDAGFFTGSAYVFRFNGTSWVEEQKLVASDASSFRWFGRSVDVAGDLVAVGAYAADVGGVDGGAVYLYRFGGASWSEEQKLTASDVDDGDELGWSCAIAGDTVVGGARRDAAPATESGSLYFYRKTGPTWIEVSKLSAADGAASDQLGYSLAADGDRVLAGSWKHDSAGSNAGAAYHFSAGADCEPGTPYCSGDPGSGTPCPCGNDNDGSVPGSGCDNGVFASGARLRGSGTASLSADTLVLSTTHLEPNNSGLYFQANNDLSPGIVWGDGLQCAGGQLKRLGVRFADASGYSDTSAWATPISVKAGNITAGDTKRYQCWYRTTTNPPCGSGVNDFNASNGYAITWAP